MDAKVLLCYKKFCRILMWRFWFIDWLSMVNMLVLVLKKITIMTRFLEYGKGKIFRIILHF